VNEHTAWEELAAGYVLHALEPGDEQAFVDHFAGCAACERAVSRHEQVSAHLADLSEPEQPPGSLWTAIHAALEPRSPSQPVPTLHAVPSAGESPQAETAQRVQTPGKSARSMRHRLRTPIAAAAAVLVAAAVGIGSWQAFEQTGRSTPNVQALSDQCHADSGCHVVAMSANGNQQAVLLVRGRTAKLLTPGLPDLAADQTYVLWQLTRSNGTVGVVAFRPGGGERTVSLPKSESQTTVFAISREHGHRIPAAPSKVVTAAPATS
jgi:anti-sigma-K factor RskA